MFLAIVDDPSTYELYLIMFLITFEDFTEAGLELNTAGVAVDGALDVEAVEVVRISGREVKEGGET